MAKSKQRTTQEIAGDISAAANEYHQLRQRIVEVTRKLDAAGSEPGGTDTFGARRIASLSTELARMRERERQIASDMETLNTELTKAEERERQDAAENRAALAPDLRAAAERKRKADARVDAALRELEAAWNEGDTAARQMHEIAGKDVAHAVERMRSGRPLICALMAVQTGNVPLSRRIDLPTIGHSAAVFSETTAKLLQAVEVVADRYEGQDQDKEAA